MNNASQWPCLVVYQLFLFYLVSLGPLIRSWCMRYEAKNSYFKRLAVSCGNFINLPYSLTKRHLKGLSYRLQTQEGSLSTFLEKRNQTGPGTVYTACMNNLTVIFHVFRF